MITIEQREKLRQVGLEYDDRYKIVRCSTCGCPQILCTCKTNTQEGLPK